MTQPYRGGVTTCSDCGVEFANIWVAMPHQCTREIVRCTGCRLPMSHRRWVAHDCPGRWALCRHDILKKDCSDCRGGAEHGPEVPPVPMPLIESGYHGTRTYHPRLMNEEELWQYFVKRPEAQRDLLKQWITQTWEDSGDYYAE